VWAGPEDDHILVCTSDAIAKAKDMRRGPRVNDRRQCLARHVDELPDPERGVLLQRALEPDPDPGVLAVFTAASLASGLAPAAGALIAARAGQGLGAALFTPAALSVIMTSFAGAQRAAALGVRGGEGDGVAAGGVSGRRRSRRPRRGST
jgi:hypothetical protein